MSLLCKRAHARARCSLASPAVVPRVHNARAGFSQSPVVAAHISTTSTRKYSGYFATSEGHHLDTISSTAAAARTAASSPRTVSPQVLLAHYSQLPTKAVTLHDLLQYGTPPLSEETLLQSGERTRLELLKGLARRVTQHLSLPFLPATNPSLQAIHNLYSSAFFELAQVPEISTLEDNDILCRAISQMVEAHRDNIPILAKGFRETRKYIPADTITQFLDRAIRSRITLRLMAEQHLSLSAASLPVLRPQSGQQAAVIPPAVAADPRIEPSARATVPAGAPQSQSRASSRVGILDLALSPREMISSCAEYVTLLCDSTYGVSPHYRIEGLGADTPVGAIGSHLEYILTELLKNAFRATVEFNTPKPDKHDPDDDVFRFEDLPHAHLMKSDLPEVIITVGVVEGVLTIRVRDRGGGVPPENADSIFSYAFTSVPNLPDPDSDPDSPGGPASEGSDLYGGTGGAGYYGGIGGGPDGGPETALQTSMGTLAGLGFGLPLSRLYSGYFGGSLDLVTMHGWGTDVYCVLRVVERQLQAQGQGQASLSA